MKYTKNDDERIFILLFYSFKKQKYFLLHIFPSYAELIKLNAPKAEIEAGKETKFATMSNTPKHIYFGTRTWRPRGKSHTSINISICNAPTHAFISFLFSTHC